MEPYGLPRAVLDAIGVLVEYLERERAPAVTIRRSGSWSIHTTETPAAHQGRHLRAYLPQTCAVHPGIVLHLYANGARYCPQCRKG